MRKKIVLCTLILLCIFMYSGVTAFADDSLGLVPIENTDYYIKQDGSGFYVNITDSEGNKLVETDFRNVEPKLGEYDTIKVWYPEGMQDLSAGLLDKNLNVIVPRDFYSSVDFVEKDGKVYAKAESAFGSESVLYEINTGDENTEAPSEEDAGGNSGAELVPIENTDYYIKKDGSGFYVNITDSEGNKLVETDFRNVEPKLGEYDTIKVWYPEGMQDLSAGLLDKNLNVIVPRDFYSSVDFVEKDGKVYAKAESAFGSESVLYEINTGDENVEAPSVENSEVNGGAESNKACSSWAEESIRIAEEQGLVPQDLRCDYTGNITRGDFCRLAVQTYIAASGKDVDLDAPSPFIDADDPYITAAYALGIVSGVGNDKFAPDNNITRQEAAVMLNNLAAALGKENNSPKTEKYVDESYFAKWAINEIYKVSGMKSGDTYVMMGTGEGKFSPWMNYTREQAIATMLRLYSC